MRRPHSAASENAIKEASHYENGPISRMDWTPLLAKTRNLVSTNQHSICLNLCMYSNDGVRNFSFEQIRTSKYFRSNNEH